MNITARRGATHVKWSLRHRTSVSQSAIPHSTPTDRGSWTFESKSQWYRSFSVALQRPRARIESLPRHVPLELRESSDSELLHLRWSRAPQNILLIKKDRSDATTSALVEFANHIKSSYSNIHIILESAAADELAKQRIKLDYDVTTLHNSGKHNYSTADYHDVVDLVVTFGGDGTILHAASLFASSSRVPPVLSFSMGTLGFLGEWKFSEHKRAFRETYMSGSETERRHSLSDATDTKGGGPDYTGWSSVRGKTLGSSRGARVLVRHRLRVGVFDAQGKRLTSNGGSAGDVHAMNEVLLHRGRHPHLAIVDVFVGGRFLTEAVADGMIISTPTGSTAYSLSSGGSIIHPLVPSLLLTPICPRSLSFRPLVLPARTPITLRLSEKNRGRDIEVSIDGARREHGIGIGAELRVSGENIVQSNAVWTGGIPCIMRRGNMTTDGDDGWVGGLNGLLKFNYAFGEEN